MGVECLRGEVAEQGGKAHEPFVRDEHRSVISGLGSLDCLSYSEGFIEPDSVRAAKSVQMAVGSHHAECRQYPPFENLFKCLSGCLRRA